MANAIKRMCNAFNIRADTAKNAVILTSSIVQQFANPNCLAVFI
jgi:hypothetical protein